MRGRSSGFALKKKTDRANLSEAHRRAEKTATIVHRKVKIKNVTTTYYLADAQQRGVAVNERDEKWDGLELTPMGFLGQRHTRSAGHGRAVAIRARPWLLPQYCAHYSGLPGAAY